VKALGQIRVGSSLGIETRPTGIGLHLQGGASWFPCNRGSAIIPNPSAQHGAGSAEFRFLKLCGSSRQVVKKNRPDKTKRCGRDMGRIITPHGNRAKKCRGVSSWSPQEHGGAERHKNRKWKIENRPAFPFSFFSFRLALHASASLRRIFFSTDN